LSAKPRYCVVFGGINDCVQGVDPNTAIANLTTIYQQLSTNGIIAIACTVTPSTQYDATKRSYMNKINRFIKNYAAKNKNMILCDWSPLWVNQNDGSPLAGVTNDGTHPSIYGAYLLGKKLADTLRLYVNPVDTLCINNLDESNILTNPLMLGSNNGVATGYSIGTNGTSVVYTASKVARNDGLGEWQQVAVTGVGTAKVQQTNSTTGQKWNVGDEIYALVEFETDDNWVNPHKFQLTLTCLNASFTGLAVSADLPTYAPDDAYTFANPRKGVFKTPPIVIPSGTTMVNAEVAFNGVGTYRVGRFEVRKVDTMMKRGNSPYTIFPKSFITSLVCS
jgi:hypothetical protein